MFGPEDVGGRRWVGSWWRRVHNLLRVTVTSVRVQFEATEATGGASSDTSSTHYVPYDVTFPYAKPWSR